MFAPSPSPTLSPRAGCTSRRAYHAQPAPLSPRLTSPRHEQRYHHRAPTTPSPRPRPSEPVISVLPFAGGANRASSPAQTEQQQQQQQQQSRKRTADATTQYTPPGLPPTAKKSQVIDRRTGRVQDRGSSGASTPSSLWSASSAGAARGTGGGPAAEPLAGPSGPPQSRDREPHGDNGGGSGSSGTVVNGDRPKTAEQVLGADKTPGEARTRVKDVIGPAAVAASSKSRDGHRRMDEDEDEAAGGSQSSSPKKARQEQPPTKIMPLNYEDCDVQELGVLIADMLLELVRHNDALPLKDRQLTRFHSRAPPGISIADYLNRLITHATLIPPLLLSMVYYIDRLCALYPVFTISSLTVHRFLITAATVAAKGLSDSFWTNNTYARVGGVTTRELALLELDFLEKTDWRILPQPEVLSDYYRSLVERADGYELEKRRPPAPSIKPQDAKWRDGKPDSVQDTAMR